MPKNIRELNRIEKEHLKKKKVITFRFYGAKYETLLINAENRWPYAFNHFARYWKLDKHKSGNLKLLKRMSSRGVRRVPIGMTMQQRCFYKKIVDRWSYD